jgi:tetratricopeptide (TPR) repeat protein
MGSSGRNRFMARPLVKLPFVLLAFGLWILTCPALLAKANQSNLLNKQINKLFEQGKYQEAIPLAEQAVRLAKWVYGPDDPSTANSISKLGLLYYKTGEYAKAEPLYHEALQVRR